MSQVERSLLIFGGMTMAAAAIAAVSWFAVKPYAEAQAYSAAWPITVSSIGTKAVDSARNAVGSFALGVASELEGDRNKDLRNIKRNISIIDSYYDAGVDFQEKHGLTKAEMAEFAQSVVSMLDETGYSASSKFQTKYSAAGIDAPGELWNIAILKGIIQMAGQQIQIDDRLIGRIDEMLDDTKGELRADLLAAQKIGEELAAPLLHGNDRLWAGISNSLRMDPIRARSSGKEFMPLAASDRVAEIDVMEAPVDAVVDPFSIAPSLGNDHTARAPGQD